MNEDKHRFNIYLPILFSIVLAAGLMLGARFLKNPVTENTGLSGISGKLNNVINYINDAYVDSVDDDKLIENAVNGMLNNLDPHSCYISAEEFNEVNDPLLGSFEGIGVQFHIMQDTITVINVVAGGPSEKIGIKAGDRIVKVDGKNVAGVKISNNDVLKKLKGKKGTKVKVSIIRRGVKGFTEFTITRDVIPTFSVDAAYMVNKDIGYIKISNFSETTHDEYVKAFESLKSRGLKKMILDLRGNAGGFLKSAVDIADEFLEDNKLIVYTKGRKSPEKHIYATKNGDFEQGELAVLIDDWSASASEIVAGAIQDNDRGLVIGRRSFGKGLVQEQMGMSDGSAVRLTIARYYTPTGRCIQKPYQEGFEKYYSDIYERYMNGEFKSADSIKFADSLKYTTPKGKVVYGGGGIMPDIYVPAMDYGNCEFYKKIINTGLIYQFAFEYVDNNRKILSNYKDSEMFERRFEVDKKMYDDFVGYAMKNGATSAPACNQVSEDMIKTQLKALISRDIFDDKGYYPIINKIDKTFLKAVEVLQKN